VDQIQLALGHISNTDPMGSRGGRAAYLPSSLAHAAQGLLRPRRSLPTYARAGWGFDTRRLSAALWWVSYACARGGQASVGDFHGAAFPVAWSLVEFAGSLPVVADDTLLDVGVGVAGCCYWLQLGCFHAAS
jgi:hypothetical protein